MINPTQDDQKKLAHIIRHIVATRVLPLMLSIDKHGIIERRVDAYFAVHDDMKSYIGLCMRLSKCTVSAASIKQKLNSVYKNLSRLLREEQFFH